MSERRFPIQGHTEDREGGGLTRIPPMTVPWIVGEIAYNEYARRYGRQQSIERLAERAGFGQSEMDDQFPQWRELTAMLDAVPATDERLEEANRFLIAANGHVERLREALEKIIAEYQNSGEAASNLLKPGYRMSMIAREALTGTQESDAR